MGGVGRVWMVLVGCGWCWLGVGGAGFNRANECMAQVTSLNP